MSTKEQAKILIVDDRPINLKLLFSLLQESGFKVLVAKTGESALQKLQKISPDLILLDVMMPGLDGFETCRRLKASAQTKDIPVIFMMALSESIDKIKGLKIGAVDYITKPFQQEEVLARIENQIKIRRLSQQLEEQHRQLQQSQSLLARVLKSSLDGVAAFVAIRDSQGKIIDFKWLLHNPAAEKIWGRTASELVDKQLLVEMPGHHETGLFDMYVSVVETGEPLETDVYYAHETIQAWFHIVAVKLDDGLLITFRDITERKQAEVALKESEARFQGIFENAAIAIGLAAVDGTLIAANPTYAAFFGYSEAEIGGLTFAEITHPDDLAADIAFNQELIDGTRNSFQLEKRYIRKDGQIFWARLTVCAVRNLEGEFQYNVAIIEDINDRKLREFALRESERKFRASFNDSFQFTALLTPKGTVIEANQTALDFGGVKPSDVAGVPFWESCWWREGTRDSRRTSLPHSFPETRSPKQEHLREATQRAASGEFVRYEVDIIGVGDSILTLDFSIKPVLNETGKVVLLISEGRDITEYKRAQEALLSAQKRLEYLLSSSPSIIYTCQTTEPYGATFISENITAALGYEPREFIEDSSFWVNHIHPDDTERIFAEIPQLFTQGHHAYEYRLLHKDGTYRWVYDALKVLRDQAGNPLELVGSWLDITERKQIKAALQESQRWLQAIAEANPNILYVYDLIEQRIVYSNRQLLAILGYRSEEVQQMGTAVLSNLMHPEDLAVLPDHFNKFETAKEGQILDFECRMRHKNGEWYWLLNRQTLFTRSTQGKPKQILSAAADISDRKRVQLEIATAKTALEQQIQRVLLLERITQEIRSSLNPEQIFQTAATQIGEAFNANRCLIHTYSDHPIPRIPLVAEYKQSELESLLSLEISVQGNALVELMLTQDRAIASNDVYNDLLQEAASSLGQQIRSKSILAIRTSYQGKPNGAIGIHQCDRFRQWTESEIELLESVAAQLGIAIAQANLLEQEKQRRQELDDQNQALKQAKLEAETANRAKSQFLSKMSHELRTPLNAILGFTQLITRDNSLKTEQLEYLSIINRSGEHLLELINDILSMSKIEAGQLTLNENRFDLYQLLDSLEEMLRLKASSKNLQLIFKRAKDVPQYVKTDESKLRQVLINLLGNAIKFTQQGQVMLRVSGSSRFQQQTIHFEVEDTGPGIAPEEQDNLFEPFVQTKTGRQSMEGTGLGLPISQQFVRLMGGDITVSSRLGRGAIFTFHIQVGWATATDEKVLSSKRGVIGLEPNQPSYRILVVEDATVNRKLLIKILEPLGFEVRTATNGQEAIALWESWAPHLIWMDMIMPVMDGYEATQHIKQTPKGQDTIIIALTADAFEEQRAAILNIGCNDFLPKPFQREALLEKMAHYLGVRYIYAEPRSTPSLVETFPGHDRAKPEGYALTKALTPADLTVMPASWISQLHQAALYADDELMNQLIEQIPLEYSSLHQALRDLLNNFRLEQLINLTELAGS